MSISNNLRQMRLDSHMTQEQVAEKLGVTRQAVSSYESGRTRPDIDMLIRMCDTYGTDLDGIVYGQNHTLKSFKRVKVTAVIVFVLLMALTILSSSLFWSAHKFFPFEEGLMTSNEMANFEAHVRLSEAWETVDEIILTVSRFGFGVLLILMIVGKCVVPIKYMAIYTASLAAGILLVILPFAATDRIFSMINYYITPSFVIGRLLLFFILSLIIQFIGKRDKSHN